MNVYYGGWQPYVPVAERRRQAEKKVAQLKKKGQPIAPVTIEGRIIAASFWGKSWCTNLERYSDYESRLPRGRSYVRNGSVVDLQVNNGEVTALVAGSELYKIKIGIAPVKQTEWKSICRDCAGSVSSLVELLQGRIAKSVMDRVCREGDGLFPAPKDIKLSCSCPDWASMCKHVAAALYGVGARLDSKPELLFVLRGVDQNDLLSAGPELALGAAAPGDGKLLDDDDIAALFGLEMVEAAGAGAAAPDALTPPKRRGRSPAAKASAGGRGEKGARRPAKIEVATAGDAGTTARPARSRGNAGAAAPSSRASLSRAKKGTQKSAQGKAGRKAAMPEKTATPKAGRRSPPRGSRARRASAPVAGP